MYTCICRKLRVEVSQRETFIQIDTTVPISSALFRPNLERLDWCCNSWLYDYNVTFAWRRKDSWQYNHSQKEKGWKIIPRVKYVYKWISGRILISDVLVYSLLTCSFKALEVMFYKYICYTYVLILINSRDK